MKRLCLYLAIVSWGWLVLYMVGSFIAASFDVMAWDVFGRLIVGFCALSVAGIAAFVFASNTEF